MSGITPKSYASFIKNIKHYFHKISFAAIIGPKVINLSDYITSFNIFKAYNELVFPVVAVSLNITPEIHSTIAKNINIVKFRLNLEKFETTDISDASKGNESTASIVYKNLILELSDYDKARFRDESEQYSGGFENALKINVQMELFKADHLKINKRPINGIFTGVKMNGLLVHLLSKTGQKMLIQTPNRTEKIRQVVLPNKNLVQTVHYLQKTYGIYRSGLRLFFDFDRGYCLTHDIKNNPPISEREPFEYKNVVCYIGKSSTETSGCWLDESTKTYYLLMPNSDQITFSDKSAKELYGNKLVFRSSSQSRKTMNKSSLENNYSVENDTDTEKGDKVKYYFNSSDNDYAEEELLSTITRNELKYVGDFKDIDTSFLTMNKSIYLNFLDDSYSQYNGMYEIDGIATSFTKIGRNVYETDTIVNFSRLLKDYMSFS